MNSTASLEARVGQWDETGILICTDIGQWEEWLAAHHDRAVGVWLKIAKKGAAGTTITITEALDGALCFGWIDSHRRGLDADHYLQRYSPRRPKSPWSQVNVGKAEALIATGRMRAPGFAAIAAAQSDGRWSAAYAPQRTATCPADLRDALGANPLAQNRFEQLDRTAQYAHFLRLMKARTSTERADQLRRMVAELAG
ncbi:YdeI/OmpD-associated family protein [Nocardia abscessus]|uniref:YdeI/OmpD-associated family protein n=1 Tax=Nocardia abscessus TaxID=120957 RepID=UPI0006887313|nr:YdeI/OmpD-associated family protein [Nocardia abscessus]MCC3328472.1 YdeI/OmpD-associated family protein [Nocardia abscessus]